MLKQILSGLLALAFVSCGRQPADQVNVFNGTDYAGNTYPGATVPFGAVQLSPDTDVNTCSGYHYSHDTILGFSHTHLSGTGCPDLGDFLVTPGLDVVEPLSFSHQDEKARPGYYKVSFDKYAMIMTPEYDEKYWDDMDFEKMYPKYYEQGYEVMAYWEVE